MQYNKYLLKVVGALILSLDYSLAGYPLLANLHSENYQEKFTETFITLQRLIEKSDNEHVISTQGLGEKEKLILQYDNLTKYYINGYILGKEENRKECEDLWLSLPIKEYGEELLKRDFFLFLHLNCESMIAVFLTETLHDNELTENDLQLIFKNIMNVEILSRSKVLKFFNPAFDENEFIKLNKLLEEDTNLGNLAKEQLKSIRNEREKFFPLNLLKNILYKNLKNHMLTDTQVIIEQEKAG